MYHAPDMEEYMKLKEYLFINMMTQEEFAKKAGCSRNYISMLCRNKGYPGRTLARNIHKITKGLVNFSNTEYIRRPIGRPRKLDKTREVNNGSL